MTSKKNDHIKTKTYQEKWHEKNGMVSRTMRLYQDTLDQLEGLCDKEGLSKTNMIQRLMDHYTSEKTID